MGSSSVSRGNSENSSREGSFSNAISKDESSSEDVIIFISLIFLNLYSCIGFKIVPLLHG